MSRPPGPDEIVPVSDSYMRNAGITTGSRRKLTICRALGQLYVRTRNEEARLLLRYASTLAHYYVYKLMEFDQEWADNLCPRYMDFDKVMRREKKV